MPSYRSVFPQIAVGGPWRTFLILMNFRNNTPVEGKLIFRTGSGTPWEVSLSDGRNVLRGSDFAIRLAPNQTLFLETVNPGAETRSGWALVEAQRYQITGHAVFRAKIAGRPDLEAVVPAESLKASAMMAFDNTNDFMTSVALCVPSQGNPADIYAEVYSEDGVLLETYKLRLEAGQHVATESPNLWPVTANRRGMIRLLTKTSTDNLFSGLVLLFNPSGAMTSVPLVDTDIVYIAGQ